MAVFLNLDKTLCISSLFFATLLKVDRSWVPYVAMDGRIRIPPFAVVEVV